MCLDYCIADEQKLKFSHNVFDKNVKRCYDTYVGPTAVSVQHVVDHMRAEYNSRIKKTLIKNIHQSLNSHQTVSTGLDAFEALPKIYSTISRLYPHCPPSHPGELHKIKYLRAAEVFKNGQGVCYRASLHISHLSNNSLVNVILPLSCTESQRAKRSETESISNL